MKCAKEFSRYVKISFSYKIILLMKPFKDKEGQLGYFWVFLSGAFAGVANASVLAPVEHIRIRMQVNFYSFIK